MSAQNPISPKVVASTAGAGIGAAVSSLLIWLLGITVWGQPATADAVNSAVAAVPAPVSGLIVVVIAVVGALVPGWRITDPNRVSQDDLQFLDANRDRAN